jgi:hypothetical protein
MSNFLKNFGLGIVYILLLPILVAVTLLVGLYGLCEWIVLACKGLVRFFKGDSFFAPMQEDEEVVLIKKAMQENIAHPNGTPAQAPAPNNVYVQNNYYQTAAPNTNQTPNPNTQIPQNNAPIEGSGTFVNPTPIMNNPANQGSIAQEAPINQIPQGAPLDPSKQIAPTPIEVNVEGDKK